LANGSTERRASPRESVDYAARLEVGEHVHSCRLTSLSRMGALVVLEQPLAVGTPVVLDVELRDGKESLRVRGQVVRVEASGTAFALGFLFAPLPPALLARIDSLVPSSLDSERRS
jgi:hypothetical protein